MALGSSNTQGAAQAGGKFGDLRRRLVFLLLALIVFRIGAHIPVPGIDPNQLAELFSGQKDGILGMFNLFSLIYQKRGVLLNLCALLQWLAHIN